MSIVDIHIAEFLEGFVSSDNPYFERVYEKIQDKKRSEYKPLLRYIHEIVIRSRVDNPNGVNCLHLNFEDDFDTQIKNLIAELLIVEHFEYFKLNDSLANRVYPYVQEQIQELNGELRKLSNCPDGASGKNGGNKVFRNWRTDKSNAKDLLEFYGGLDNTCSLNPRVVINCKVKLQKELLETFQFNPFLIDAQKFHKRRSYCVANAERGLNELDALNLVDDLEVVILFDCEQKGIMTNFSVEELSKWNQEYETLFKHCIVITFGKDDNSFQGISNKIDLIKSRFKIQNDFCYTISSSEVEMLLGKQKRVNIPIRFNGPEHSIVWDEYLLEVGIRELYELRSVKLMNVFAITFNENIKDYILDDIFSAKDGAKLISNSTKQTILELRDEDRKIIMDSLTRALNLLIQLNLRDSIAEKLRYNSKLLVSDVILKDNLLMSKFSSALNLGTSNHLMTWSNIDTLSNKPIIILSYRDQGHPPYYFFPNVVESLFPNTIQIDTFFVNIFFGGQFEWSKYRLNHDLAKYLNHPIRRIHFEWEGLKIRIEKTRPPAKTSIDWGLENEYAISENRETIKVKFSSPPKTRTYSSADLFIVRADNQSEYRVEKINDLLTLDLNEETILIQNLDEIQEDINIYEKIIDLKQQEDDLKIIRNQFDIKDKDPSKLWKILLKNIADAKGYLALYKELGEFLELRKLKIVSLHHFKNSWISLQSDSISPISNRVFIAICEYLHIPRIYYLIMQRIKNASKQASRQSARQMNLLLKDLFNDGCFDDTSDVHTILSGKLPYYYTTHPINELGIDKNSLLDTLVTLVELILPELKLLKVQTIEKIE